MKNLEMLELNSSELNDINGGGFFVPLLIWAGKAAATAVAGYVAYEVIDGVVKGVAGECDCQ
ncbi:MAG: hypothetical protein ACXIUD_02080 [Mongoliitalea sp.]